jgi:hypothetical protein
MRRLLVAALAEPHDQATFWCSDPIACVSFPVLKVCYALIGRSPVLQHRTALVITPPVESGSAAGGEPIILVFFHRYADIDHGVRLEEALSRGLVAGILLAAEEGLRLTV